MVEHVRPKYACEACQANVVIAERLPEPIEKGFPGPGLLAHVIVSKYADHLPLYRQEGIFRRHGVELSRQTICDWMAVCAELLEPIVTAMHSEILQSRVIQTDDTTVPVLDRSLGKDRTGRLWDLPGGSRSSPRGVRLHAGSRRRGPAADARWLWGLSSGRRVFGLRRDIRREGDSRGRVLGDARRKFDESKSSDPVRAHVALAMIERFYWVEKDAKELDDAARAALRQERSRPILEEVHAWLVTEKERCCPRARSARRSGMPESLEGPEAIPGGGLAVDRQ